MYIYKNTAISPGGNTLEEHWIRLLDQSPARTNCLDHAKILTATELRIKELERNFHGYDRSTYLGWLAVEDLALPDPCPDMIRHVIFGSSRGAAGRLESDYSIFHSGRKLSPKSSPVTTPGILPASIARRIHADGMSGFVSSACSTGLQAIGLATALIQSCGGEAIVGASVAPLTPYVLQALRRAGVMAKESANPFLGMPGHLSRSGIVLSEGAAALYVGRNLKGLKPLAKILGFGFATESGSLTGISDNGLALQQAINRSLESSCLKPEDIDLIIGHGAGTKKGDFSEFAAYASVFKKVPSTMFMKWLTGHSLAPSSVISVAVATQILQHQKVPKHPYQAEFSQLHHAAPKELRHILVAAMGFGGSAAAVILAPSN